MGFYSSGRRGLQHLVQSLKGSTTALSGLSSNGVAAQLWDSSSQALSHLGASSSTSSSSSRCMCRAYSDYAARASGAAGRGLRRVNPSGGAANGSSAAAEGAASTSGQAAGASGLLSEMKEVPGGSKPLRRWEYYYWGLGATGIAFLLYNRLKTPGPTDEEIADKERKIEELRARRKEHIRTVLTSQNFLLGDRGSEDPFEGLAPEQIVMFCEKYNIDPSDPLEGLTPEEIDAYMAQQAARQEEQDEA